MAGDWIKMRVNLVTHPKVLAMADELLNDGDYLDWSALSFAVAGYPPCDEHDIKRERYSALRITRYVCVTSLLRFWGYANEHAKGEFIDFLTIDSIDEIAGVVGFGRALVATGWAVESGNGILLPGFSEHNTSAEVRKTGAAERQKAYRERLKQKAEPTQEKRDVTRYVTSQPREEKRREDIYTAPDGFDDFWKIYPSKKAKPAALKAFKAAKLNGSLPAVLAHVGLMADSEDWKKNNGQFVPMPATYLNQRRWEDEAAPSAAAERFV